MYSLKDIFIFYLFQIPADPFEAELLALAGNIAEEDKDSSASEYEDYDDDDGRGRQQIVQEPIPDLENEMAAERIVPKPLPISTPEPPPVSWRICIPRRTIMFMNSTEKQKKRIKIIAVLYQLIKIDLNAYRFNIIMG